MSKKIIIIAIIVLVLALTITAIFFYVNSNTIKKDLTNNLPGSVFKYHSSMHEKRGVGDYYWFKTLDEEIDYNITFLDDSKLKISVKGYSHAIVYEDDSKRFYDYDEEKTYHYELNVSFFGKAVVSVYDYDTGKSATLELKLDSLNIAESLTEDGLYYICEPYQILGATFRNTKR